MSGQISRRRLSKAALSGAVGVAVSWPKLSFAGSETNPPQASGVRLALDAPAYPKDEDILFLKQVGVDCVDIRGTKPEDQNAEGLRAIHKLYTDAGILINDADNPSIDPGLQGIVLNGPQRDAAIEAYKSWIRSMGEAGFSRIKPIQFDATSNVASGDATTRSSRLRDVDLNSSELAVKNHGTGSADSLLFGREYSRDEIWANYTYFIEQIAPVAEEAGIKIGLRPDDPPCSSLFGVPRIFSTFEDYKKALKIANSSYVGICFVCGSWLEGGKAMGIDAPGAIHYFASQKQLFSVYFRNPSSPLPHFHETYVDEGYYDMYKIVKALVDVKYDGEVTIDRDLRMVGGPHSYAAFGVGYMRALLQCAQRGYHA